MHASKIPLMPCMPGHMRAQVSLPGEVTPRERHFKVQIKWAATVNIQALLDFVQCAACARCPHR